MEKWIEHSGGITLYQEEDVEPVIKANQAMMAGRSVFDKKGDLHHVMRIPMIVLEKIRAETGLNFMDRDDAKKIMTILKGPEYSKFRTAPGKI